MKAKTDHAWMLDVLRDLAAYADNHEIGELSQDLLKLSSHNEALLLGKVKPLRSASVIYRRDFSV